MKYIKKGVVVILLLAMAVMLVPFMSAAEDELPEIPINTSPVVSITLTSLPNKLNYFVGEDIDLNGAVIRLTHEDGFSESYKVNRNWCGDVDNYTPGTVRVFVDYPNRQGYTGVNPSFNVTFSTPEVSRIRIEKLPDKTEYYTGDAFVTAGIQVFADYTNGDQWDVTPDAVFSGYDPDKIGKQTITVSYSDGKKTVTASFNVYVTQLGIVSMKITHDPTRLEYVEGEELILDGIAVELFYNDEHTVNVSDLSEISVDGYNPKQIGKQEVKIICRGAYTTLEVTTLKTDSHRHTPGNLLVVSVPDCVTSGISYSYCIYCGEKAEEIVYDPIGHLYTDWISISEPTTETDGEMQRMCTVCNYVDKTVIEKLMTVLSSGIFTAMPVEGSSAFPSGYRLETEIIDSSSVVFASLGNIALESFPDKNIEISAIYHLYFTLAGSSAVLENGAVFTLPALPDEGETGKYAVVFYTDGEKKLVFASENDTVTFEMNGEISSSGFNVVLVTELKAEESTAETTVSDTTGEETTEPQIRIDPGEAGKIVLIGAAIIAGIAVVAFVVMLILKKRSYKV